jgi:hypothetical protein
MTTIDRSPGDLVDGAQDVTLTVLGDAECRRLFGTRSFGRLGVVAEHHPRLIGRTHGTGLVPWVPGEDFRWLRVIPTASAADGSASAPA